MARKYNVEGTNDFLIAAVVLFGFGLWCVKDGWFPSREVQQRHPIVVEAAFERDGVVREIPVRMNQEVSTNQVLARLDARDLDRRLRETETVLQEARVRGRQAQEELQKSGGGAAAVGLESQVLATTAAIAAAESEALRAADERQLADLKAPTRGEVIEIRRKADDIVKSGDVIAVIDPMDHFYAFNKSLAFLCLIGSVVCGFVHRAVR